jgi:hypothetical protein
MVDLVAVLVTEHSAQVYMIKVLMVETPRVVLVTEMVERAEVELLL